MRKRRREAGGGRMGEGVKTALCDATLIWRTGLFTLKGKYVSAWSNDQGSISVLAPCYGRRPFCTVAGLHNQPWEVSSSGDRNKHNTLYSRSRTQTQTHTRHTHTDTLGFPSILALESISCLVPHKHTCLSIKAGF